MIIRGRAFGYPITRKPENPTRKLKTSNYPKVPEPDFFKIHTTRKNPIFNPRVPAGTRKLKLLNFSNNKMWIMGVSDSNFRGDFHVNLYIFGKLTLFSSIFLLNLNVCLEKISCTCKLTLSTTRPITRNPKVTTRNPNLCCTVTTRPDPNPRLRKIYYPKPEKLLPEHPLLCIDFPRARTKGMQ